MTVWLVAAIVSVASAQQGSLRVVGGHQVGEGDWPDAAGVADRFGVVCTGTLVAPTVVLTAGHCTQGPSLTQVVLDTNDYQRTAGEVIDVEDVFTYPQSWNTYDIAVLVLEEPATVPPRVIARDCVLDDDYLYDGAPVAIVGYGAHDVWGEQYDSRLREAFTEVTDDDCTDIRAGCNNAVSPGGEIGAGGGGVDACYGDSGGPLYLLTPDIGSYLVGVTSRGWDTSDKPCEDGGVYVRPDAVIDWIEEVSGVTLPVPTCNQVPDPDSYVVKVGQGRSVRVRAKAHDPDQNNGHVWAVVSAPEQGSVTISDNGVIEYDAPEDYLGEAIAWFSVTDEGVPSHTAEFRVTFTVVERTFCGCSTPGSPASLGGLALLGLLLARRRRG